jgi:hypothetical protein
VASKGWKILRSEYTLAAVAFLATTFLFFRPHILGKAYFWDDFTEQVYPNRVYAGRMLESGTLPQWNPYSFCGMPFQADVQTALYYPPNMLFDRLIGAHRTNGVYWLQLLIIAHFFVAQLTMYLLARQLGLSPSSSGIAAIGYAFAAPLALHTHHPMFIEHLAWLPLVVLLLRRAIVTSSIAAIGWGGLVGGIMLLSGAPQMSLYALTLCSIVTLWWAVGEHATWRGRLVGMSKGIALIVLAVGIYGIQYFPSRELAEQSERVSLSFEQATEGSLAPEHMLTALTPKAFGVALPPGVPNPMPYYGSEQSFLYWDTAFYFGIGILALALWAAVCCWRESQLVKLLVIVAVLAVLFALGSNGFLYPLVYKLPLFGQVRIPARMMFAAAFSAPLLAAYGWERMARSISRMMYRAWFGIIGGCAVLVVGVGSGVLVNPPERMVNAISASAWSQFVFLALVATAALLRLRRVRSGWLSALVAAIVFFDLQSAHAAFSQGRTNPADEYRAALPEELRQVLLPRPPERVFRVSMRRPGIIALKRNQGLVDGVMLFEGYNQLLLRRRHPAVASPEHVADLLSIRWAIAQDSIGRWAFRERQSAFPMAWLVHSASVVEAARIADVMRSDTAFNYRTGAILEEELPYPLGTNSQRDSIGIVQYTPDRVRYYARSNSAALAVLSEIFYPAWNAYVDGVRVPVYRVNYCLRGVFIPPGEHQIELRYESATFATGSLVTAASLATAAALVLGDLLRKIQRRRTTQMPPS